MRQLSKEWILPRTGAEVIDQARQVLPVDNDPGQVMTVIVDGLIDDAFARPFLDTKGNRSPASARGLTAKGYDRLERLEHPVRHWMTENWFPLIVAIVASVTSIGSLIVSIV